MKKEIFDQLINDFKESDCINIDFNSHEEMKYVYLYAYYYYGNNDIDNCIDIENGINFSKKNDNCLYGGFKDNKSDEETLDLLTALYQGDNSFFDKDRVSIILSKIDIILMQYKSKTFNQTVETSRIDDYLNSNFNQRICIKLISNYKPESAAEKENIIASIKQEFHSHFPQNLFVQIIFEDDLEELVDSGNSVKESVDKCFLRLDKPNNYLEYGGEKSIIVNIKASSLKENYMLYGKNGLFAMNLRLYVKSQKVDSGIENSIKENGENFWYKNNGVIFVCDDYKISDTVLTLINCSIVNGGQTTRMIGETKFEDDFLLICKVVKNKYNNLIDKTSFVAAVAEASNTQKPIKAQDLIANRTEQRLIKNQLISANVFVTIKRGEIPNKEIYKEPWQKTTNTNLAQLIYSGVYQCPGVSRNSPTSLFTNQQKYDQIFGTEYDSNFLVDLLYIQSHYKKWSKKVSNIQLNQELSEEDKDDKRIEKGLVKNGAFYIEAMILLIAKLNFSPKLLELLNDNISNEVMFKKLYQGLTFKHRIFNCEFAQCTKAMYELFDFIVGQYFKPVYKIVKEMNPALVYSNFTKTDTYYTQIVKYIVREFSICVPSKLNTIIEKLFYKENENDKKNSNELLEFCVSYVTNEDISSDNLEDPLDVQLYEALKKFRTDEFTRRKIKAYYVFTDKELMNIIELKPTTIEELRDYNCFKYNKEIKEKLYGSEIVKIVSRYLH